MTDTIQSINKHLRGLDAELERERKQLKQASSFGELLKTARRTADGRK